MPELNVLWRLINFKYNNQFDLNVTIHILVFKFNID